MNRKVLTSLLIIGMALAAITGATLAWFTDEATGGDATFTAGTVEIEADATANVVGDPIDNWAPGDTETVSFEIRNTGSLDVNLRVLPSGEWGNMESADNVTFALTAAAVAAGWSEAAGEFYYDGLAASGDVVIELEVTLAGAETGNEYQGAAFTMSATVQALQADNTGEVDFNEVF